MVGATKGSMDQQENLFVTPSRPGKLTVIVERLWTLGDDVVEVTTTTRPTKGTTGAWTGVQRLEGPDVDVVVAAIAEASVSRFYSANWGREGRQATYEGWRQHLGLR